MEKVLGLIARQWDNLEESERDLICEVLAGERDKKMDKEIIQIENINNYDTIWTETKKVHVAKVEAIQGENKIEFNHVYLNEAELIKENDKVFIKLEVIRDHKGNFGYITIPKNEI